MKVKIGKPLIQTTYFFLHNFSSHHGGVPKPTSHSLEWFTLLLETVYIGRVITMRVLVFDRIQRTRINIIELAGCFRKQSLPN